MAKKTKKNIENRSQKAPKKERKIGAKKRAKNEPGAGRWAGFKPGPGDPAAVQFNKTLPGGVRAAERTHKTTNTSHRNVKAHR